MNKVDINSQDIEPPSWCGKVSEYAKKVLKELKKDNWELSILFCSEKNIKKLNSQYRNKNESTDILSFNLGETLQNGKKTVFLPGDIVISPDIMRKNAKRFKISEDEELRRLIIHGILHLDGMNHETNEINEPMLALQEKILAKLNCTIIGGSL